MINTQDKKGITSRKKEGRVEHINKSGRGKGFEGLGSGEGRGGDTREDGERKGIVDRGLERKETVMTTIRYVHDKPSTYS